MLAMTKRAQTREARVAPVRSRDQVTVDQRQPLQSRGKPTVAVAVAMLSVVESGVSREVVQLVFTCGAADAEVRFTFTSDELRSSSNAQRGFSRASTDDSCISVYSSAQSTHRKCSLEMPGSSETSAAAVDNDTSETRALSSSPESLMSHSISIRLACLYLLIPLCRHCGFVADTMLIFSRIFAAAARSS